MDAVDEIKTRLSIEDVIAEYVQLKRAGRNFKGLSPFTSEKTPSFVVSPEKQIWHDFSSGRGGDVFTFVQEVEGLDFKGALELLARKAGVDLDQYRGGKKGGGPNKERLYKLCELAVRFYQVQFSKSKLALEYVFKQRQFSKETALAWQFGYAPNTGSALVDFAKSKGFTPAEIKQAGLTNRFGSDFFRGRLMIPLHDASGRPVGFTARQLDMTDEKAPKYINTSQTPLYDKSRHVFGLHLAKVAIRKNNFVVLAEGNLDVVASHQAGVAQCVATAGTALTEHQLKALSRFTGDIRLSFDADRAGIEATERAIPIASKVGVSLSVISVPAGKDPDELIREDVASWQKVVSEPTYAFDWLMEYYQRQLDLASAQGKRKFSDIIIGVVRGLSDEVEREHYVQKIATVIGSTPEAVRSKLTQQAPKKVLKKATVRPQQTDAHTLERIKTQNKLMTLLLLQPRLRDLLTDLQPIFLPEESAQKLLAFLQAQPDFIGSADQVEELRSIGDYVKILTLQYEELYQGLELLELRYEAERQQMSLVEQYVKTEKEPIRQALARATGREEAELLAKDKTLTELLHRFRGGH